MPVLVTDADGVIGIHVAAKLFAKEHEVIGLENFCSHYD